MGRSRAVFLLAGLFAGLACEAALALPPAPGPGGGIVDSARQEQQRRDLQKGDWIDVWGPLEAGELKARRLRVRSPRSRQILRGVAKTAMNPRAAFSLLGVDVEVGPATDWRGMEPNAETVSLPVSMIGSAVRVDGEFFGGSRFRAARVSSRESTEPSISARVGKVTQGDDETRLQVLHVVVIVDEATRFELADEVEPSSEVTASRRSVLFGRDEDDALGSGFELARGLGLALQHQLTLRSRDSLRADDDEARDDADYLLRARLAWRPTWRLLTVTEVGFQESWRRRDGVAGSELRTELREAFVFVQDVGLGFDMQIGRIDFDEQREWLYDQSLDGLRFLRRGGGSNLELGVMRTTPGTPLRERSNNVVLYVSNVDARRRIAAYWLHRDFTEVEERRSYFGARVFGRWWGRHEPWLELSYLTGDALGRSVSALAVDSGATFRFGRGDRFSAIAGYAWGSGSDRSEGTDHTFRQTGFDDNDNTFAGVTSYRYYGELFDPELANLHIATLGFGVRLPKRSSIDLVGHLYRLDQLARSVVDADIDERLTGRNHDLGWEVDLVGGLSGLGRFRLELVAGLFERGDAFRGAPGKTASLLRLQVRYRH